MERFYHNLKPNESTRIPRRHVFLDSEARESRVRGDRVQTFRCAVATYWTMEKGKSETQQTREYSDPVSLWHDVMDFTRGRTRTVLWAHNLGYDVRIVECLTQLPRNGWSLVAHNFAARGTWLQWRRDQSSITMVDSASVWGVSLAQLGEYFGIGKLALPSDSDGDTDWLARCRRDVDILTTAVQAYLRWIEDADMGNWQHTGAGQAWADFRHRFLTHTIAVHDDGPALAAERAGMYTGRCEAYWHGADPRGVYHEWDLTLAYPRIARDTRVPVRLMGPLPVVGGIRRYLDNPSLAILAHCQITTDVPVVPTRVDGRIIWPTGTFESTLWDVEIRAALDAGASIHIVDALGYRTASALEAWGKWIIAELGKPDDEVPAWQKVVLKHRARALIGRFAMTYTEWEQIATAADPQTRRVDVWDAGAENEREMLQVGHDLFQKTGVTEWRDSCPMITSYIMSVGRVRLWDIMRAAPKYAVRYADTDSIICHEEFHNDIKAIADSPIGHGLRLKKTWQGLSVWGPRQIVTGELVRVAGLPRRATRTGRETFVGEAWESLPTALRRGRPGSVMVAPRHWTVRDTDHRRELGASGWTRPHRIGSGG